MTTTNVSQLKFNKLTESQYQGTTPVDGEFYITPCPTYALDDEVVHKAGTETITGLKILPGISSSEAPIDIIVQYDTDVHPESNQYCRIINVKDNNGNLLGNINAGITTNGQYSMCIESHRIINGTDKWATLRTFINEDGTGYITAPASDVNNSIVTTVAKNKAQNGYVKLGNGIIIQWGWVSMYSSNSAVTFQTPFSNTNYALTISFGGTSERESSPAIHDKTTTTFKVKHTAGLNNGFGLIYTAIGY